ncbi:MAG: formate--tetrahydrofolate ligase [candidate division NC10 bacterium]|nr:formate--tetrahydrofolate ligase [candidate division NC10 bacterium]
MKPDIVIAQEAKKRPIAEIATELGFQEEEVELYGRYKAKVSHRVLGRLKDRPYGKLIMVTGITPTPAGEGKTTLTVGLGQALGKLGKKGIVCLREPSLGPCFGLKGGAAGGGYSQVVPMEDINLHFTGDLHAVGVAHNLLAALIDNHIYQWNHLQIDPRRILWRRVVDINDRALRNLVLGLGGALQGVPRETGFDITAASEVMAILCLAENFHDLKERLGRIVIGHTYSVEPVTVKELRAQGAMAALLKDAINPNLVQTLEGTPAFIHGGPFANIAHGCNSVIATKLALKLGDFAITETGFGFDLGGEKFLDIKCPYSGLKPDGAVLVVSSRALKHHGGVSLGRLKVEDPTAVRRGLCNLDRQVESLRKFHLPFLVAINRFTFDTEKEIRAILRGCEKIGVEAVVTNVWAEGGPGGIALIERLLKVMEQDPNHYKPLYDWNESVKRKIFLIASEIYGAKKVEYTDRALLHLKRIESLGLTKLPICIAKTQRSLSDNPELVGRPENFTITVREIKIAAGAGFLVPMTGEILSMPGLPRKPSAEEIDVDAKGRIIGLF